MDYESIILDDSVLDIDTWLPKSILSEIADLFLKEQKFEMLKSKFTTYTSEDTVFENLKSNSINNKNKFKNIKYSSMNSVNKNNNKFNDIRGVAA